MTAFRETGRVELDIPCGLRLEDGTELAGRLLDLGLGGGRIAVEQSLATGSLVTVVLEGLCLRGRMIRQEREDAGWVVALEWAGLSPGEAARLARWIAAQPRTAPFDGEM